MRMSRESLRSGLRLCIAGTAVVCGVLLSGCEWGRGGAASAPALMPSVRVGMIWDDPLRCVEAVGAGKRQGLQDDRVRGGTWNLRWFPDGVPGTRSTSRRATDVQWLACVLTYLQYDVVGLQEVKLTRRGRAALDVLVGHLRELSGVEWRWISDDCADPAAPHVLLLYRPDRLSIDAVKSHPEIDPTSFANSENPLCPGVLRPALGAYFTSLQGGVDFHFVSSHLDGGDHTRDFHNRVAAWRSLDEVFKRRQELNSDPDVVFAADFNSVGSPDCGVLGSAEEHNLLKKIVGALEPEMTLAHSPVACSNYYRGEASYLDQVIFSKGMEEVEEGVQQVLGVCRARRCEGLSKYEIPALNHLSDHCPVVFDIRDVDLD